VNFLKWLRLIEFIMRILELLDDKGKETVAKKIADTINKPE
jgi:hypothetical protein